MLQLFHRYQCIKSYLCKQTVVDEYPLELVVEVTNRCNLNCIICPRDKMNRKISDMPFELFKKIIDEVRGKVEMIDLCFAGESLLHKDIFEMIKYAKQNKIKTFIQTNCMDLDTYISKQLIDSGLDLLVLSIDAADSQTYKIVRSGGDYERVVNNAMNFLQLKKSNGKKNPYTIVQMVYTKFNKDEVKKFYSFWRKYNVDAVRIKPFNTRAGLVTKDYSAIKNGMNKNNKKPCIRLWRGMAIYCDGKVVPCCMDYTGRYIIGDVNENSVAEIWNSEPMVHLRELHLNGEYEKSELCKNCEGYSSGMLKTFGSVFFNALTIRKFAPVWNKARN